MWERALIDIEQEVSEANYKTWFVDTYIRGVQNGCATVACPNAFIKEWLHTKYERMILRILREVDSSIRSLRFVVKPKVKKELPVKGRPLSMHAAPEAPSLPLTPPQPRQMSNLNPRYTFDTFVVGGFNELAYSAGQAILQQMGVYNPLYIYGDTGLGKTHLIQAIGNTMHERFPELRILYTNSEKFTMEYVHAIKHHTMPAFKEKYRSLDVLIMDDIQFFSGKDSTQEELFHLFNALYDRGRQIIFSSDKHPNYIIGLEERLKSRFSAGMIVDVIKPDYESRKALLQRKVDHHGFVMTDSGLDYIAQHVNGSIRELEGIVHTLKMQTQLKDGEPLDLETIQKSVRNSVKVKRQITAADVARAVAQFYNVDEELLYAKTRRKEAVFSRQVVMYLMREDYHASYPSIGRDLGGRDHTTVMHSCEKIKKELEESPILVQDLEHIRSMLQTT